MPAAFIPFAERSGLIGKVTLWVIDEAVRQCREWADQGHFLTVAINISQSSLLDPAIGSALVAAIEAYDVPASAIEVEITESALTADLDGAAEALAALHAHGVRISIDDYGTGYSSIAHLRALPVQCIKIDRSYVANLTRSRIDGLIVTAICKIAASLEVEVIAEGVETVEQLQFLQRAGVTAVQGYLLARPEPLGAPVRNALASALTKVPSDFRVGVRLVGTTISVRPPRFTKRNGTCTLIVSEIGIVRVTQLLPLPGAFRARA